MKQFIYTARDANGKILTGAIEANDRQSLIAAVSGKGFFITHIKEVNKAVDVFKSKVSTDALLAFTRKLKVMLQSGIDMLTIFKLLWSQTEDKPMQLVISELRTLLSQGVPLTAALKRFPATFSETYISLISVGERGGVLIFVLEKIMEYLIRQKEILQKLKKALMYPVIVLTVAVMAVAGMFLFFIPMFEKIFVRMKVELPLLTKCLVGTSHFFMRSWWIFILVYIMIMIAFKEIKKTSKGRYFVDKYFLRIPVIGRLIFYISLSRFLHTFSVLLESGVPLVDTVNDAMRSTGNMFISKKLADVQIYLSKGASLSDALERTKIMPPFVLSLVAIGEESGSLAKNLKVVAEMVDEDVDYQLNKLTTLLGPLAIIFVGGFVGVVLVAIYSPIFSLWGGLQR